MPTKADKKTRIDKWLWAVRIFKSRTLSTDTVKRGKVTLNGKNAKPSHPVTAGDRLTVMKNGFQLQFEVIDVISKRVGAPLAQLCYVDHTPEEELNKYKDWFVGKGKSEMRSKGLGRPTKRDRRDLNRFKSDYLEWDEADE